MLAGAALRLWFIHAYAVLDGDPLIYGDIAKNLLTHGVYGLTGDGGGIRPTLIRLPGYPLFLAACFKIFGLEHYRAVLYVQAAVDLASCLLIAAFVRRIAGEPVAAIALWFAVLCPFTANYVATPLAETLSIFCVAMGLYALARLLDGRGAAGLLLMAGAVSYAALLRPDGALLGVVLCPAAAWYGSSVWGWRRALQYAVAAGAIALLPFLAWTARNYKTFHVVQPLAPRYAVDPGESDTRGFNRWMKTWCVDFTSTYEVYWNEESDKFDLAALPERAFDSEEQREQTANLLDDYNEVVTLTPSIDGRFGSLAAERIHGHLLRYYVGLPVMRVADMWLRPRTENLPIELRWWQYGEHRGETVFALAYGALNFAYLAAALFGMLRWPRFCVPMVGFVVLRSVLLATLEAPEPRYTLECFPIVIVLAAVALGGSLRGMSKA